MKFILLSVVCLLGAVAGKPALTKQKRDILPGDPRYGTDYHNNHHHAHQHDEPNEVEISRSVGGYVGSYIVPESSAYQNNIDLQLLTSYGPPNYTPGAPIGESHVESVPQIVEHSQQTVQYQQVQASSVPQESVISNFKPADNVETVSNAYRAPVVQPTLAPVSTYQPLVHQQVQHHVEHASTEYLPPGVQRTDQKPVDSYGEPIHAYGVPATVNQEQREVIEVRSQASSNDVESSPSTEAQQEVGNVQNVQVEQQVVHQVHAHVDTQAQAAVETVQTQEQVQHTVQPSVQHYVQRTAQQAQPAVQQQNVLQETAQLPQFESSDFSGNSGGSLDSGFQTYGAPSISFSIIPHVHQTVQSAVQHQTQKTVEHFAQPAVQHSAQPAVHHSAQPTTQLFAQPAVHHSAQPAVQHFAQPAVQHFAQPAVQHFAQPAVQHFAQPAVQHFAQPAVQHSAQPAVQHSARPTTQHFAQPAVHHSAQPAVQHSVKLVVQHSAPPAVQHSAQPAVQHSAQPAVQHFAQPAVQHFAQPAVQHFAQPAVQHSAQPAVHHYAQPAVQHFAQPAVQHFAQPAVHHSAQPAVQQQNHYQQAAQLPQIYSISFVPSQPTQAVHQQAHSGGGAQSESVSVKNVHDNQAKPSVVHVNTHSNANSYSEQGQAIGDNGGYVY